MRLTVCLAACVALDTRHVADLSAARDELEKQTMREEEDAPCTAAMRRADRAGMRALRACSHAAGGRTGRTSYFQGGKEHRVNGTAFDTRVVMMAAQGCSGSTYLYAQVLRLFKLHGWAAVTALNPDKEILKTPSMSPNMKERRVEMMKEPYCTASDGTGLIYPDDAVEKLQAIWDAMNGKGPCTDFLARHFKAPIVDGKDVDVTTGPTGRPNLVLLFTGNAPQKVQADVVNFLAGLDGRGSVAGTVRNPLKRELCNVNDCWSDFGVPVLDGGTESKACFERRKTAEPTMVRMRADVLRRHLEMQPPFPSGDLRDALERSRYGTDFLSYEDLSAFEYDAGDLPKSMAAWTEFLKSMGLDAKHDILEAELQKMAGSRKAKPLQSVIYNYEEVRDALRGSKFALDEPVSFTEMSMKEDGDEREERDEWQRDFDEIDDDTWPDA